MQSNLKAASLETALGTMLAIGSEEALCLLEFVERPNLNKEIERLEARLKSPIISGKNALIDGLEEELKAYFSGKLQAFQTPLCYVGTPFQRQVWQALQNIPFGETLSYLALAKTINRPTACRAVAQANRTNQLAIVIPCHRVINTSGKLGGYAGGIDRKQALLALEKGAQGPSL